MFCLARLTSIAFFENDSTAARAHHNIRAHFFAVGPALVAQILEVFLSAQRFLTLIPALNS